METFADKIIAFNRSLDFEGKLPEGISIMNPFRENNQILPISLEHPRFVMQYKSKSKREFVDKYIQAFKKIR